MTTENNVNISNINPVISTSNSTSGNYVIHTSHNNMHIEKLEGANNFGKKAHVTGSYDLTATNVNGIYKLDKRKCFASTLNDSQDKVSLATLSKVSVILMIFPYLLVFILMQCNNQFTYGLQNVTICYNKTNIWSKRSLGEAIDVSLGSTINLECHYCNEPDDYRAKVWYFRKLGNTYNRELMPNMNFESEDCKVKISPSHTLHLKNFESNDSGVYFCQYFLGKNAIFTFVLDGVHEIKPQPRVGTYNDWVEFQGSLIDSLNHFIRNKKAIQSLSLDLCALFPFEVVFSWENWGPCERFGNEILQRKTGKCRVRPIRAQIQNLISSGKCLNDKLTAYLFDITRVSCRSIALNSFYPKISRIIRNVPDFVIKTPCNLTQLSGKVENVKVENNLKCNVTKHVAENGYLILSCPELITESQTDWYKDNIKLNSSFRNNMALSLNEPHLTIDAYNALYILNARKSDEGFYSCTVNGRNMQNFLVKVVTKAKLLNKDFIRYSIYLGFVLSLTVTCYCAGICVAWQRRASFADPLNLMKKRHNCSYDDRKFLLKD